MEKIIKSKIKKRIEKKKRMILMKLKMEKIIKLKIKKRIEK